MSLRDIREFYSPTHVIFGWVIFRAYRGRS
jgi:hypothetical protein